MEDFYYKRPVVRQKAMALVRKIYRLGKLFSADERYALSDQIFRVQPKLHTSTKTDSPLFKGLLTFSVCIFDIFSRCCEEIICE